MLKLYSLERRRERYTIIYTWKIQEGLVPNLDTEQIRIQSEQGTRIGRSLKLPSIKARQGKALALKENSLAVRGPRLFNHLPKHIRNISNVQTEDFKKTIDRFDQNKTRGSISAKGKQPGSERT